MRLKLLLPKDPSLAAQNTGVAGETEKRLQEQLTCWGSRGRTFSRVKERGKRTLCSAMLGRQYISASFLFPPVPQAAGHGERHTNRSGSEPEQASGMLAKKSTREAAGKKEGRSVGLLWSVPSAIPSLLRPQGKSVNCQCCGGGVGGNARSLCPALVDENIPRSVASRKA